MSHSSINNRLTNKTSITTARTEYLYRLNSVDTLFYDNIESMPKRQEENAQYLLSSDKFLHNRRNIDALENEILGLDMREMLQKLFDMHQKYINKEGNRKQLKGDIEGFIDATIKTIEKLKTKHKNMAHSNLISHK